MSLRSRPSRSIFGVGGPSSGGGDDDGGEDGIDDGSGESDDDDGGAASGIGRLGLAYNGAGRLTQVRQGTAATAGVLAGYSYNALGQRVAKEVAGVTTHFHYDRTGRLLAETDGLGGVIREYLYLDGQPLALVDGAGALAFVHPDHLDTPQVMIDAAGAVVWERQAKPFGETLAIAGLAENPLRFPGQIFDAETGLHYNYFRDYDPSTGRYLQTDPIGLEGGLNIYAYVGGNPINAIDPSGKIIHDFIRCALLAGPINRGKQDCRNELDCLIDEYGWAEGAIRYMDNYDAAWLSEADVRCACKKAGKGECTKALLTCVQAAFPSLPGRLPR